MGNENEVNRCHTLKSNDETDDRVTEEDDETEFAGLTLNSDVTS